VDLLRRFSITRTIANILLSPNFLTEDYYEGPNSILILSFTSFSDDYTFD